ncbi:MAG: DUF502 domain-containing protein [Alphaproteobacteria bacterium]|jgi:uncharacterized membrane protein|nr:DUF502 domain-containing protein [Alphaproteobacteria bacterium]MBT4710250.1 DUF502 domain-containing protein [Alphaproteobacteria bacterium]MBT5859718.1 DUF502 domain-containing protein [Alphaproteobacteria bacterium]
MTQPDTPDQDDSHLVRTLRNYFITGLVVTGPVLITLFLVWRFIGFIDRLAANLIPGQTSLPFGIPGLGLIIVAVAVTMVGAFTANFLGSWFVRMGEKIVDRMPVVRSVYGTLKKIFTTVLDQSSRSFREVVMLEYPRQGIWAIGFVTGEAEGEVQAAISDDLVNVFVPTTPNPTSGYLVFLPRKDLIPMTMSVEDGIKLVISGGIMTPEDNSNGNSNSAGSN